jgi:phenylacetate-CoA ligase
MTSSKYLILLQSFISGFDTYCKTRFLLWKSRKLTKEQFEQWQFVELKRIIKYAYGTVPYYSEIFQRIGFHPEDFKSIQDLKKLPFLTKEDVRQNQDQLISGSFNRKHLKVARTGGTSGLPMTFYLDKKTTSVKEMVFLMDIWKRIGYKLYDRCIVLREDDVPDIIPGKKYWKMNVLVNWLVMSTYHLNKDTFQLYYKKIIQFKPKFIIAFPSAIYMLSRFIKENKLPVFTGLKGIICSSENILPWQREYVETLLKVRILSYYGHSEKCTIASECLDEQIYEFYPQYGYIELINKQGEPCTKEDERGEIVVTGFQNYASPFIRYKTNDIGIYTNQRNSKHPYWFAIKGIEGRIQDFIINEDGTTITAVSIDRPFWELKEYIYAYQYIQNEPGILSVHIHAKYPLKESQIEHIKKVFADTYCKFTLHVEQVDHIPRTSRGKFKYLIQNLKVFSMAIIFNCLPHLQLSNTLYN